MRVSLAHLSTVTFAGCVGGASPEATTTRGSDLMQSVPLAADTFINSAYPDNNNGGSDSIYTGRNGMGGFMRGLVQFTLPAALQGRVTVTGVRLAMTTRGLSAMGPYRPAAATASLQALDVPWTQGTGVGNAMMMNTVGDPCGTTGATWNQPSCAGGAAWSGRSVASPVSGQASVPAAIDALVTWDSTTAGNAGMIADVQSWIDRPANNHGWRIASSTEPTMGEAQRFYSSEAGAGVLPALTVTYECKAGLSQAGTDCIDGAMADGGSLDGAAAGTGGAAGSGGGGAAGGSAGTGTNDGGGCSCSLLAARSDPWGAVLLAIAALIPLTRRRRWPS